MYMKLAAVTINTYTTTGSSAFNNHHPMTPPANMGKPDKQFMSKVCRRVYPAAKYKEKSPNS